MIGQTFTLIGNPKLMFRLVWRGSIAGIDCVQGVALNGKFQTMRRAADVVVVEAAQSIPQSKRPFANLHAIHHAATATRWSAPSRGRR
ncbi:MAG TPA: hypothetical protein VFE60_23890 [Roseiarcus sp.]|jgi:hypothetical protein|nr:hypothetical protein [Roseiarcus sp.]